MRPKTTAELKRERSENTAKVVGILIIIVAGYFMVSAIAEEGWPEALFWLALAVIVRLSMRRRS